MGELAVNNSNNTICVINDVARTCSVINQYWMVYIQFDAALNINHFTPPLAHCYYTLVIVIGLLQPCHSVSINVDNSSKLE